MKRAAVHFVAIASIISAVAAGLMVAIGGLVSCSGKQGSITCGTLPFGSTPQADIAQEQGYFAANGLTVDEKYYTTGIA
jgi:ABC-type nitrate/sulfonate/bicarbonate transport system substrate-binding protein